MNNVLDFGAKGDGKSDDTLAIQKAIDAGGTVYFPQGEYLTGTLYLKSNGGLFLDGGAVIKASHNREKYNSEDFCVQNEVWEEESMSGTHLITAVEQENVFICGFGTVDGDTHYWVKDKWDYCNFYCHPPIEAQRPAQMLYFVECKNVRVQDVTLKNAPFWHLFFHGCEGVFARGLNIKGETEQWVNDGIDIDCCRNVMVSDCLIETGDDGITLRARGSKLKEKDNICEDITVSNCVITSYLDYGVRIGVGEGIIRNVLFSNIIIKNSLNGIGITCRFLPEGDVTSVENIRFNGLSIKALCAFEMKISNSLSHPPLKEYAYIRNISLRDFYAESNRFCYIQGFENGEFSNVNFTDGKIRFIPEKESHDRKVCVYTDTDSKKSAFYIDRAENVSFENVTVENNVFEKTFLFERSSNITVK